MSTPTSFRFPFDLNGKAHPVVEAAIRYAFTGIKDLNDAVGALVPKVNAHGGSITTINETVQSVIVGGTGGGGTGGTGTDIEGMVNIQPPGGVGTSYTTQASDFGGLIVIQSPVTFALTLNSGLTLPFYTFTYNVGTAPITITASTGLINNSGPVSLLPGQFALIFQDTNRNWWVLSGAVPPGAINFSDDETPAGVVDGVNKIFTLTHSPSPVGSLELFNNGLMQDAGGDDFTLSGSTITFVVAPTLGSTLIAWYRY